MLIREVLEEEKTVFNRLALHPLQSWEWGEFRARIGQKVRRLGVFDGKKLISAYQVTIHQIPHTDYSVVYFPRGPLPDKTMLEALTKIGREENAIFVKMEPAIQKKSGFAEIDHFLKANNCRPGKPIFSKYTFWIDLTKKDADLLSAMHPKTRYNLRLAQKYGISVSEENSQEAFETHLKLHLETAKRQGFYSHTADYHRKMWEVLFPQKIAHLLIARYKGKPLVSWILFVFNNVLYYPYGGSSREYREMMPSYAMMWEAIQFGKKQGCSLFDLWGSLGPDPSPSDPWFGFHRFKMGFSPTLIEFIGAYDLVLNPPLYRLYHLADTVRWLFLRLKAKLPF